MPVRSSSPPVRSLSDSDPTEPPASQTWTALLSDSISSLNETETANLSTSPKKDISFSSTMELESCVNAGNYTNMHSESNMQPPEEAVGTAVPRQLRKVSPMVLHSLEEQTSRDGPVDRPPELDQKYSDSGTSTVPFQDEETIFPSVDSPNTPQNSQSSTNAHTEIKGLSAINPDRILQVSIEKMPARLQPSAENSKTSRTPPSAGVQNGCNIESVKGENKSELPLNRHGNQQSRKSESLASSSHVERPAKRYTLKSGYCIDLLPPGATVVDSDGNPKFASTGSNKVRISSYDLRRASNSATAANSSTNGNSLSVDRNANEKKQAHRKNEDVITKKESVRSVVSPEIHEESNEGGGEATNEKASDNPSDRGSSEGFSEIMKKNAEETVSA